jgi:hypothetical protein
MISPDALRHTADVIEASAIGERMDRRAYLLARFLERCVAGGWDENEMRALIEMLGD